MEISKDEIYKSHNYRQQVMADIRAGKLDSFAEHYQKIKLSGAIFSDLGLSDRIVGSRLRSAKNHLLSMNSMSCLMAEYGGMDAVSSHYMAEKYAILIEEATSIPQLDLILADFLYAYLDPRYRSYNDPNLSLDKRVDSLIENQFMRDLTVADLAEYFNFSREYLSRQYKSLTGQTIGDKIQACRIKEAQKLLGQSKLTITEIANLLGYSSSQYFAKVFKKVVGTSPSNYRKFYK